MARKQKLLSQSTGHLRVVEQEAKYKAEFMAADGLPELQKTPPAHLDKVAKAEYRRIISSIGKLPLRNLDRSELELYCTWYSIYKDASVQLNKEQSKKRKNIAKINNAIKTSLFCISDIITSFRGGCILSGRHRRLLRWFWAGRAHSRSLRLYLCRRTLRDRRDRKSVV